MTTRLRSSVSLHAEEEERLQAQEKLQMETNSVMADSPTRVTMCVTVHLRGGDRGTTTDPQVEYANDAIVFFRPEEEILPI